MRMSSFVRRSISACSVGESRGEICGGAGLGVAGSGEAERGFAGAGFAGGTTSVGAEGAGDVSDLVSGFVSGLVSSGEGAGGVVSAGPVVGGGVACTRFLHPPAAGRSRQRNTRIAVRASRNEATDGRLDRIAAGRLGTSQLTG